MRPFSENGWAYYDKVQAIMPTGGARGHHSRRSATVLPLAPATSDEVVSEGTSAIPAKPTGSIPVNSVTPTDESDSVAFTHPSTHPPPSTVGGSSTGKRLHSDTVFDSVETTSYMSSSAQPVSTTLPVSAPSSKKARLSSQAGYMSSAAKAAKVSPAAAVMNMQGTLNRMADAFVTAVSPDALASVSMAVPTAMSTTGTGAVDPVDRAIDMLETLDGDLPDEQKGALIQIFATPGNEQSLAFYIRLKHLGMRRAFLKKLLRSHGAADDAGDMEMT
jgi:hypothetical protein